MAVCAPLAPSLLASFPAILSNLSRLAIRICMAAYRQSQRLLPTENGGAMSLAHGGNKMIHRLSKVVMAIGILNGGLFFFVAYADWLHPLGPTSNSGIFAVLGCLSIAVAWAIKYIISGP
jgi:hypothetical protein